MTKYLRCKCNLKMATGELAFIKDKIYEVLREGDQYCVVKSETSNEHILDKFGPETAYSNWYRFFEPFGEIKDHQLDSLRYATILWPRHHGKSVFYDYQRKMVENINRLYGLNLKKEKPMATKKGYKPTAKPFKATHLLEEMYGSAEDMKAGAVCAEYQYESFDKNFLRPNTYTITQSIPKNKLLEYALTRNDCFINWLVRKGYYEEVYDTRMVQLVLTEDELHKLHQASLKYPVNLKSITDQLNQYINDPNRNAFKIREEAYQYDSVIKLLNHCMKVGSWNNKEHCIEWIKARLDGKK